MTNYLRILLLLPFVLTTAATAAPLNYKIDPDHTYPSVEADHMGLSTWRGKFNHTTGKITLDTTAGQGTVDVHVGTASIDFGLPRLNAVVAGPRFFDADKYPEATYVGTLEGFTDGAPSRVAGNLTLHGVTKPVALTITSFKCVAQKCGADATGSFNRDDFGLDYGKQTGFKMLTTLRIQVEATQVE